MSESEFHLPGPLRRLLASLVPIVCPRDAAELGVEGAIVDHAELSIGAFEAPVRLAMLAGLATYELGGVAYGGRPASRLPRERAARYFALWWRSPIGLQHELAKGMKGLLCLAHYEQPAVQAKMGYTAQAWIDGVARKRLAVHGPAIQRAAAKVLEPDPLPGVAPPRRRAVEVMP